MSSDSIRILVADEHRLFGDLLSSAFRREPGLVSQPPVRSVADTLQAVRLSAPDVVVTELRFGPYANAGLGLVRQLKAEHPAVRTLVLTSLEEYYFAALSFAAGASGFLHKSRALDEVTTAVCTVNTGAYFVGGTRTAGGPASLLPSQRSGNPTQAELPPTLTDYETQLLQRVSHGTQLRVIAESLGTTTEVINVHLTAAFAKLGSSSAKDALRRAIQLGLIT